MEFKDQTHTIYRPAKIAGKISEKLKWIFLCVEWLNNSKKTIFVFIDKSKK